MCFSFVRVLLRVTKFLNVIFCLPSTLGLITKSLYQGGRPNRKHRESVPQYLPRRMTSSVDTVRGTQTQGGRMEGTDESTELWRQFLKALSFHNYNSFEIGLLWTN